MGIVLYSPLFAWNKTIASYDYYLDTLTEVCTLSTERLFTFGLLTILLNSCVPTEKPGAVLPTSLPTPHIQATPTVSPSLPSPESSEIPQQAFSFPQLFSPVYVSQPARSQFFVIDNPSGQQIAWQNAAGNLSLILSQETSSEAKFSPPLHLPNLVDGMLSPSGDGVLIVREEERSNQPDFLNPVHSRFVTVNKFMSTSKAYPKRQIQSVGLDAAGNGYILFSDEYPQPDVLPADIENVKVYYAKVENYIPLEIQELFQTDTENRVGTKNVVLSKIDVNGSGFFVHYSGFKAKLLKIQQLKITDQKILDVFNIGLNRFALKKAETKNFIAYLDSQADGTPVTLSHYFKIQPISNDLPDGKPATSWLFDQIGSNLFIIASDVYLDAQGNGLFAMLKRDTDIPKDTLILYRVENHLLKESREYDYPRYGAMRDLKIVVNASGARLFFMDALCDSDACSNDQFELGRTPMQVGYIHLNDAVK